MCLADGVDCQWWEMEAHYSQLFILQATGLKIQLVISKFINLLNSAIQEKIFFQLIKSDEIKQVISLVFFSCELGLSMFW